LTTPIEPTSLWSRARKGAHEWRSFRSALARALHAYGREHIGTVRLLIVVRLLRWPVRAAMRPLLRRLPRDPKLIAFGVGGNRFADNPAYLFLHMSSSNRLRCVWVTGTQETVDRLRAAGYDAVRRWTVEGVWVALRASWYVFSSSRADINGWFSDGATALNLWHGVGVSDRVSVVGSHTDRYLRFDFEASAMSPNPDRLPAGLEPDRRRRRPGTTGMGSASTAGEGTIRRTRGRLKQLEGALGSHVRCRYRLFDARYAAYWLPGARRSRLKLSHTQPKRWQ